MNKKAQRGPIAGIFLLIVFIVLWFVWLGSWVNYSGNYMITNNNLVGIEAFFYANLNLWIFLALVLGTMGFLWWSSR